jgi:uncharacterized protein
MLQKINCLLVTLLMLLCINATQALVVNNINTASVVVTDRSANSLKPALQQALNKVLIKYSGNPNISSIPGIQNANMNSANLVKSYAYQTRHTDTGNQLILRASFDRNAVIHLLTANNQAIWNANRPLTLLWINTDIDQATNILAESDNTNLEKALIKTAKDRGLPIILPMMDLSDQAYQTKANLSAIDIQKLLNRYNADAILIGQMKSADNQWQVQWHLQYKHQPTNWMNTDSLNTSAAADGINQLATIFANQFSVFNNAYLQNNFSVAITQVNNLTQYAQLIKLLKSTPSVNKLTINGMQNSTVDLTIRSATNLQNLSDDLTSSAKLQTANQAPFGKTDLVLRWQTVHAAPKQTATTTASPAAPTTATVNTNNPSS